mmetsp:Transcript_56793/g.104328  ORF Transcript_56793/g.104328 Transcript_56793/m.104328 type:complete len:190 (-) Transcript_56793:120-689(-)
MQCLVCLQIFQGKADLESLKKRKPMLYNRLAEAIEAHDHAGKERAAEQLGKFFPKEQVRLAVEAAEKEHAEAEAARKAELQKKAEEDYYADQYRIERRRSACEKILAAQAEAQAEAEVEALAAEKKAEEEKLAAEAAAKAEAERVAVEKKAEEEKLVAEAAAKTEEEAVDASKEHSAPEGNIPELAAGA